MFIEILTAILIFSLVPIAVKLTHATPFTIGFFRLAIAALMLGFFWNKKINWRAYNQKTFWKLVVIGVCFFAHWITYTYSIKVAGPSICVLGMATYGVQLIFYGSFFLGYHIHKKNLICLFLILLGIALVIPSWDYHNKTTLGLLLALISASFYSIIPIMLQKSHEFSQETRIFYQFSIAFMGYVLFFEQTQWSGLTSTDWYVLLFLAVLGTFVAHTLWSRVVSRLPTTTTGIIYYLITPLAMFFSNWFLGESLSGIQKVGGVVILGSALINTINQDRLKILFGYFKQK